jgi:hypothetical protein
LRSVKEAKKKKASAGNLWLVKVHDKIKKNNLCEFCGILFLQAYRETDRFFADSGVLSAQSDRGFFHYRRADFEFYSYRIIGKLTVFFHLQEFCQRNQIVDSSTTTARLFLLWSNLGLEIFSPNLKLYILTLT